MKQANRANHHEAALLFAACILFLAFPGNPGASDDNIQRNSSSPRTRLLINTDWLFIKGDPPSNQTDLSYAVVKPWLLPTGNDFLMDSTKRARRPDGNAGQGVAYMAADFDDSSWRKLDLPHDYAIEGPFTTTISGSTGRLPSPGVVWYRKNLDIPASDGGKSIFLDIDGAMSYSMVWLNGHFVGGWPYGYASFRLDLTPYANPGGKNILAIRLDNPVPKDSGLAIRIRSLVSRGGYLPGMYGW